MNVDELERLLPEEPSYELRKWTADNLSDDHLGGHFILFNRESMEYAPEILRTMRPEDWEDRKSRTRRCWGARCSCTACGEDFTAGWVSNPERKESGIQMIIGDDGCVYDGLPCPSDDRIITYGEGERALCPICLTEGRVLRRSKMKNGRTYQIQICSVEIVKGIMVLLFWLASRRVTEWGWCEDSMRPRSAAALVDGHIVTFSHSRKNQFGEIQLDKWTRTWRSQDPCQTFYYDYQSAMNKKVGCIAYLHIPDLAGTTGEKTGIREYLQQGGEWPLVYLKTWLNLPNIENLMKAGWGRTVENYFDHEIMAKLGYYHERTGMIEVPFIMWDEVQPHRMLCMSKQDVKNGWRWNWDWEMAQSWFDYWCYIGDIPAAEFEEYHFLMGKDNLKMFVSDIISNGDYDSLRTIATYLKKQSGRGRLTVKEGAQLLHDYREMIDIEPGAEQEVLWPRDLFTAHERAAAAYRAKSDAKTQTQFDMITEKYAALTWNDGELCIRIAARNSELEEEGRILRHCVGSYGESHCKENDVIFFVRKYRRPERSYYTLDMRLNGEKPTQVQLHGYGNERHGVNKEHRHRIPQKVLDFVERWKTEILLPWWREEKQAEARAKAIKERKTA